MKRGSQKLDNGKKKTKAKTIGWNRAEKWPPERKNPQGRRPVMNRNTLVPTQGKIVGGEKSF